MVPLFLWGQAVRFDWFTVKVKALRSVNVLGTVHLTMLRHIPVGLKPPLLHKIALIFKTMCYLPESIMIAVLWCITALCSRCYWNLAWYLYFWWKPQSHTPNFLLPVMTLRMHRIVWMPQMLLLKNSNCKDNSNNESKYSEWSSIFSNGYPLCKLFLNELCNWYAYLCGVKR
jgi:hypothetical protein